MAELDSVRGEGFDPAQIAGMVAGNPVDEISKAIWRFRRGGHVETAAYMEKIYIDKVVAEIAAEGY